MDRTGKVDGAYKTLRLDEEKAKIAKQVQAAPNAPTIALASYADWLPTQSQCDLLLTDPPYSTDVPDIAKFAAEWLPLALSKVKPTGRAYVFIGAYPKELAAYISVAVPTQVLVWTYRNTLGPSPKLDYKLNWQAILYYRMPEAPPLDCPVMLEQFSVQDISAPDGRQNNRYHEWQKPDEIAERFVRHASKPGDTVCDCFSGTGTFLLAASKLGRRARGCERNANMLKIAKDRGCNVAK
jgi:DNA modification methylase